MARLCLRFTCHSPRGRWYILASFVLLRMWQSILLNEQGHDEAPDRQGGEDDKDYVKSEVVGDCTEGEDAEGAEAGAEAEVDAGCHGKVVGHEFLDEYKAAGGGGGEENAGNAKGDEKPDAARDLKEVEGQANRQHRVEHDLAATVAVAHKTAEQGTGDSGSEKDAEEYSGNERVAAQIGDIVLGGKGIDAGSDGSSGEHHTKEGEDGEAEKACQRGLLGSFRLRLEGGESGNQVKHRKSYQERGQGVEPEVGADAEFEKQSNEERAQYKAATAAD